MKTTQGRLTITLSQELNDLLRAKADRLGLSVTELVKRLIKKEVKKESYPIFEASDATIRAAKKAMKEIDKAVDASVFFKQLKNGR